MAIQNTIGHLLIEMTTPYIVTFEVTAKVLLEVPINASDDVEAIADAHAAIAQGYKGAAEVLEYEVDAAKFDSIRAAELAPRAAETSRRMAVAAVQPYKSGMSLVEVPPCGVLLKLFSNDPQLRLAEACETLELNDASTLAVLVRSMLDGTSSPKGYLEIAESKSGQVLQAIRAERGGWEVVQTLGGTVTKKTWLSREAAHLEAANLRLVDGTAEVAVFDFTDRKRGPTHRISIR